MSEPSGNIDAMNLLEDIINGSTDDAVSTSNLLRKVQIVAYRLGASELSSWTRAELNGYEASDRLPGYRSEISTPVVAIWSGPMGATARAPIGPGGVPDEWIPILFQTDLRNPLATLEDIASREDDGSIPWDPQLVAMYNRWIDEGKVPHVEMAGLFSAQKTLTRSTLQGIISSVRNTALDFALNLESTDPDAGTLGGPTVDEPQVAESIYNITNNIYGDGANVASGNGNTLSVKVNKGDVEAFIRAIQELQLGGETEQALIEAAKSPEVERESKIHGVLRRIKDGGLHLANAVGTEVAVSQVDVLVQQLLGQGS